MSATVPSDAPIESDALTSLPLQQDDWGRRPDGTGIRHTKVVGGVTAVRQDHGQAAIDGDRGRRRGIHLRSTALGRIGIGIKLFY